MVLETIDRKINRLENEKLKLAFRLMKVSGLRVAEVASLKKTDIQVEGNQIFVTVHHGKGGSNGVVHCMPDSYLLNKLSMFIASKSDEEKLFYSASAMKKKALELGIECHDFRRIAAITYHQSLRKEQNLSVEQADELTQEFLRHERFSTTKRYLYNRKLELKPTQEEGEDENG